MLIHMLLLRHINVEYSLFLHIFFVKLHHEILLRFFADDVMLTFNPFILNGKFELSV